jgi:putative ABC transport system permease protein
MTWLWVRSLLRHRTITLLLATAGVAISVSLLASLGSFLAASQATMTARAASGVAVDWQVEVRPNSSGTTAADVHTALQKDPANQAIVHVGYARTPGLRATTGGTTQTTGAGQVLGIPGNYATTFPQGVRLLTGTLHGTLLAQQTAANLHAAPGDTIAIRRPGLPPVTSKVAGVVELPQADSLFQRVGAPPQSQLVAPPDNVVLLTSAAWQHDFGQLLRQKAGRTAPDASVQFHVRRSGALPSDPAAAFTSVTDAANHLQAATSGVAVVGNNLGSALDAAREDAAYARILFLFLAAPGAVLAAGLTAAVTQASGPRRRRDQNLLRARGASTGQLTRLIVAEGAVTALLGGTLGLAIAAVIGATSFGSAGFGASTGTSVAWAAAALAVGFVVVGLVCVLPARRDLTRQPTLPGGATVDADGVNTPARRPVWLGWARDLLMLAAALGVLWGAGRNHYTLVLAPEGVPQLSVSYWAFLAPGLAWIAAGLLGWRISDLLLRRGTPLFTALLRPIDRQVSPYAARALSRQGRPVARTAVLVGLAFAFAASTATFNATYHQQAEVDAQLTNGADVTVNESPGTTTTAAQAAHEATKLAAVPGVRAVQPMLHRYAYVGADLQDLYGINPHTISTATTLQNPYFQGGTATQLLDRLSARPDAVLVSAETVNQYQLSLGDQLRLRLQDGRTHKYTTVTFHYAGIVNEFPTAPKDSFLVANTSYVAQQTHNPSVGTYLVNTGGTNIASVAHQIRQQVGTTATITTLNQSQGLVSSSLTSVDLSGLSRIELAYALVIAAAAGTVMLALGMDARRRGTALVTLLGAKRRQLAAFEAGEPLMVAILGLTIGCLVGWGMSRLLVTILTGVFDPPPSWLAVPWGYLAGLALVVVGGIAAATIWAARRSRRLAAQELRAW